MVSQLTGRETPDTPALCSPPPFHMSDTSAAYVFARRLKTPPNPRSTPPCLSETRNLTAFPEVLLKKPPANPIPPLLDRGSSPGHVAPRTAFVAVCAQD